MLGPAIAAVLVSTILLRRKYHGCEGRKGLLAQHARRAVRVHGLKCSPCVLRAADEAFRHRTCTLTIVALCCAVLRCWIKISIYIFFSDIYLQLINHTTRMHSFSFSFSLTLVSFTNSFSVSSTIWYGRVS